MTHNDILHDILKETLFFFENILTSEKLQDKYGISLHANKDFILNTIKQFKESQNAFIVKPFYEKDFSPSNRSIMIKRNNYGFIVTKLNIQNSEETVIEPARFVSIIVQLVEDETLKRETLKENETSKEAENDFSI